MVSHEQYELADVHPGTPALNRANYEFEEAYMPLQLQGISRGLQVGCMNGTRVVRFSEQAPTTRIDGMEIAPDHVAIARQNVAKAGLDARIIIGDITSHTYRPLERYDLVYCLNNTLGYIPETQKTLAGMRALSRRAIAMSVFTDDKLTDAAALEYFASMGFAPDAVEIDGNTFHMTADNGDVSTVRRFNRDELISWGAVLTDTPLGYYAKILA
jgi:SAM-dependent methyltransferase